MLNAADQLRGEFGDKQPKAKAHTSYGNGGSVFALANGVPTRQILGRYSIAYDDQGDRCDCPGCGLDDCMLCENGGTKCLHDRCSHVGPSGKRGFRTNVDIVAERERVEPLEAAQTICGWFSIPVPERKTSVKPQVRSEDFMSDDEFDQPDLGEPPPGRFDDDENEVKSVITSAPKSAESQRQPRTFAAVIGEWKNEGALRHEPTAIESLDRLTGGGPVYGTRWYLAGAPDAGKTLLLLQIAAKYAKDGIVVGLLAVDEEAGDLVTRFAQRAGYGRHHCEARDPDVLARMLSELEGLPVRFYDDSWTIEEAAHDLAGFAKANKRRAMFGVDSIQTVRCSAEDVSLLGGRELGTSEAVTARTKAFRTVCTRHRFIGIATSELNRGAYGSGDQQTPTLAGAKWSGAIEYTARVLIGLRSVPGESDLIELDFGKNKHGPRDERIFLRLDRKAQTLTEVTYDAPEAEDLEEKRDSASRARVLRDAVAVVAVLRGRPSIGIRELRSAVRAHAGLGHERVEAAVEALGSAVVKTEGKRGARPMTLDEDAIPEAIRTLIGGGE